ncbi:MAG: rhodanese-like domain-containing protein [Porticoccaceae bacterium]
MSSQQPVEVVTPTELYHQLIGNQQLALIDVREIRPYSQGHLLFAIPLPLARLELMVADLIPCRAAAIVICDGGSADTDNLHLGMRAARRLAELGYTNIQLLEDGICGWQAAGYELFEGVNVPSKAFGEFIEEREQTPSISPQELKAMQDQGADMVLLDSRPEEEFQMLSVPGGICCPGGELAYRVHDIVPSEDTTVVVNCAGRTRSIIGCQSLINASIPNRVVALRNGVMGWHLAGYQVAHGCTDKVSPPSPQALQRAQQSARRLIERFAVQTVSLQTLNQWRTERDTNSLYILDVRTLEEFEQQRLVDAVHAPGGQLVQNTDLYVGVRNARLVLVDSEMVRAVFAASWLMQMGKDNIFVLEQGWQQSQSISGEREKPVLGLEQLNCDQITAADLQSALQDSGVQILDVNLSEDYQKGHIEGAWFVPRARLAMAVKHIPPADLYVLTSSDGITASLTAAELTALTEVPVKVLACGNRGWEAAGNTLVCGQGNRSLEPDDRWQIPFLPDPVTGKSAEQNMREYLSWEVALVEQIQRDGTTNFRHFPED